MKLFYFLVCVLVIGCTHTETVDRELAIQDDETAIFETVLRYAFSNNASALQSRANFYAIELDGHDPPFGFIAQLDDIEKPLYPLSKTKFDCKKGVYLKNGGQRGIQFFVNPPEYESATKVKVSWGYSESCMSSAFSVMTLEFKHGIWAVLDDEVMVIS